ncbi:uncharacterized protein LOC133526648 [Cydia pomonella]|uniref:uncharacterized protein LOC133526648 n=1 Tax=Cydia pomonella TaxID=82600 RepID=UPI002ADDEADB|nr:uncharacterized protein LOC133526648 [Cydia pomonella]
MATRVLQANLNRCARAQDLFFQSLAQWRIGVAVVAEPYSIPPREDWVGDLVGSVARVVRTATGGLPLTNVIRGRGYVGALCGETFYIATYFAPNRQRRRRRLVEFEQFLDELGARVAQLHPRPVIVAGDFNAKSTAWGCPLTDARGATLEEWAVAMGLAVINQGTADTCVRQRGGSIVDITFASVALARRVQSWEVMVGVETLSDHRYIRFDVATPSLTPDNLGRIGPVGGGPRWALTKLDRELLKEAAIIQAWLPVQEEAVAVEEEASWLREAMTHVCDAAMPRAKPLPPRNISVLVVRRARADARGLHSRAAPVHASEKA